MSHNGSVNGNSNGGMNGGVGGGNESGGVGKGGSVGKKVDKEWMPEKLGVQNPIILEIRDSGKFIEGDMLDWRGDGDGDDEEMVPDFVRYHLFCSFVSYDTKLGSMFYEKQKIGEYDEKLSDKNVQELLDARVKVSGRDAWEVYWYEHYMDEKCVGESSKIGNGGFNRERYLRNKRENN